MTDREKLIDLLDDFLVQMEWHDNAELADHLLSHGVTIVEDHTGETVWGIWEVTPYHRNGRVKCMNVQITTELHMQKALEGGAVDIRSKVCTRTDEMRLGKTVFLTREEAEECLNKHRKEQK
jgi:hypothetical protein